MNKEKEKKHSYKIISSSSYITCEAVLHVVLSKQLSVNVTCMLSGSTR